MRIDLVFGSAKGRGWSMITKHLSQQLLESDVFLSLFFT